MAGRVTVSSGEYPVVLAGLNSGNTIDTFADLGLTEQVVLPVTVPAGAARTLYIADQAGTVTPTVKDPAGHVLSAVPVPCHAGAPVDLGPFPYVAMSTL